MTEDQIAGLGPALTKYLGSFRRFFPRLPTFKHLGTYCRGLRSNQRAVVAADGFRQAHQVHLNLHENQLRNTSGQFALKLHGLLDYPGLIGQQIHGLFQCACIADANGEKQTAVKGQFQQMIPCHPTTAADGPIGSQPLGQRSRQIPVPHRQFIEVMTPFATVSHRLQSTSMRSRRS